MRALLALPLAACVPVLETPADTDPDTDLDCAWTAPENDWPTSTPPECLDGEGFYEEQVVPDFRLVDQNGQTVSLWQFHGMVIFLDLSTMWCAPCQALGTTAEDTYQEHKDEGFIYLTLLSQDFEGAPPDDADLDNWANTFEITAPVIGDPDENYTLSAVPDGQYPGLFVIDRDLVVKQRPAANEASVQAAIEAVLAE